MTQIGFHASHLEINNMKYIAYTRASDGGVSVVYPAININDPVGFNEDDAFERSLKKDVPKDALNVMILSKDEIPFTREFRDAWEINDGKIFEELEKSRDIKLEKVRREREILFKDADANFNRELEHLVSFMLDALEENYASYRSDDILRAISQRQAIRDMTEPTKNATSVDELRGEI
jgi:hypothetical protein